MATAPAHFVVYVFIIVFNEFALKALFEAWHNHRTSKHPLGIYGWYRLSVLIAHSVTLGLLFRTPLSQTLAIALSLTLLGCAELLAAGISNWVYARTKRTLRPLHILYVTLFAVGMFLLWTRYTWQPGVILNFVEQLELNDAAPSRFLPEFVFTWGLAFFLASIPANYVIRWLLNKPEDATFADTVTGGAVTMLIAHTPPHEEPTPAATAEPSSGPTLKGGRVIGVLERWLVIALLARGEMAAIGFVFTAKSIVRYHDFAKPDFAEYYLIGTLYSVVIALVLSSFL